MAGSAVTTTSPSRATMKKAIEVSANVQPSKRRDSCEGRFTTVSRRADLDETKHGSASRLLHQHLKWRIRTDSNTLAQHRPSQGAGQVGCETVTQDESGFFAVHLLGGIACLALALGDCDRARSPQIEHPVHLAECGNDVLAAVPIEHAHGHAAVATRLPAADGQKRHPGVGPYAQAHQGSRDRV